MASRKWIGFGTGILFTLVAGSHGVPAQVSADTSHDSSRQARLAFSHTLPHLDGDRLKVSLVEVTYEPGGSSPPHSHPCAVIGYVAQGALRTQVKGEPETMYKAGESFFEAPNGVHLVSANASDKQPAKLIAYFVCDHDTPLSVASPETPASGGKQP